MQQDGYRNFKNQAALCEEPHNIVLISLHW